ncbi:BlaI/MecI/CopY family transcriptional regulator [Clostridioides sp. ZZV14-6153]|uniref:BlaI/MecI/CopY family transcriptional regulator n=1 Tax=Clostridioides sp. ZZV14-6153 TaxID=2811494 RepID=UPI001D10D6EE|nr:BlaI/MecI/CopY family transcriptional regulator [Clostridioides sp. ZZV14-6153]
MEEEILIEGLVRAEFVVMNYLWEKGSLISKKEIIRDIKQMYGWHKSTIKIVLKGLICKDFLAREIIRFQLHYKIIITSEEYDIFNKKVLKSTKNRKIIHSLTTIHKPVSKEKLDYLEEYYRNLEE